MDPAIWGTPMSEESHCALVPRPSLEIEMASSPANRVLSGILADTLLLAKGSGEVVSLALAHQERTTSKPSFTVLLAAESYGKICEIIMRKFWELSQHYNFRFHQLDSIYGYQSEFLELVQHHKPDVIVVYAYMGPSDRELFLDLKARYCVPVIAFSGWPNLDLEEHPELGGLTAYFNAGPLLQEFEDALDRCIKSPPRYPTCVSARESVHDQHALDELVCEGKTLYDEKGKKMSKENIRAFDIFQRAAVAGHSEGQYKLFRCYITGNGIEENHAEGVNWLRKAAEANFGRASAHLGFLHLNGKFIEKDEDKALVWLKKSVEDYKKIGKAPNAICIVISSIYKDRNDLTEAFEWTMRAAEFGCRDSLYELVDAHLNGKWPTQFDINAYGVLRLAADQEIRQEIAEREAAALAARMSPSEFASACAFYRELEEKFRAAA